MAQQLEKSESGTREGQIWNLDGIVMGHSTMNFHDLLTHELSRQDDVVRIHYGLKGDYRFRHHQLNQQFDLVGGHHNMMYSQGFGMTFENKSLEIETFGIQIAPETFCELALDSNSDLETFASKITKGEPALLSQNWGSFNVEMERVIQQVKANQFSGKLQEIFLYAKCLELLVLSAEACFQANQKHKPFVKTTSDKEKLVAARDFIQARLNAPPNLQEIAHQVGLNTYKLKRGFKELFENFVFVYLTSLRLNLALQILLDTQKQVPEVAFELGYATPQHFNNQFKQHFGFTPGSVRNNPD